MSTSIDKREIPQAGAIPFRKTAGGKLQILLITNRKGQWGIPKGLIDPGASAEQTARQESLEEAGIEGELSRQSVGFFKYAKFGGICRVEVYLLRVTAELDANDEQRFRRRQWFSPREASEIVARPQLADLIWEAAQRVGDAGLAPGESLGTDG